MTLILFKQLLRRFRENILQYCTLLVLVIVTVGIIVSLESSACTIIQGRSSHAAEECIEDGQFTALMPFSDAQLTELTKTYGVSLQKNFAVNTKHGEIQYRIFRPRTSIDMLTLCTGAAPSDIDDVVVEQNFASAHSIVCGDSLQVNDRIYTVCGTGSIPDYVRPCRLESDMAVTVDTFGWLIVSDNEFEQLINRPDSMVEYTYAYRLGDNTDLAAFSDAVYDMPVPDMDSVIQTPDLSEPEQYYISAKAQEAPTSIPNILSFVEREDNRRMDSDLDFARLYRNAGWIVGVMMVILLALIFSIVTRNQIRNEHGSIGTLYALGMSKHTLMRMYIIPGAWIVIAGGALGLMLGFLPAIRGLSLNAFHNENSFPYYDCAKPAALYLFSLVMPPLVYLAVNICVLNRTFSHPVLALLRGTYESEDSRARHSQWLNTSLLCRLLRERSGIIVFFGVLSSMTLLMLGITALAMTDNNEQMVLEHTRYDTLCAVRTTDEDLDPAGEKLLIREMKTVFHGSDLTFSLVGVSENSRFFDIPLSESDSEAVAGKALASKLGLDIGDELTFHEGIAGSPYSVRITDIVPTGSGLELYMHIDSLRSLLETADAYYNTVAFEDEPDIDPNAVYSVTTIDDILCGIDSMRSAIAAFIWLSVCSSVLIFAATLYLIVSAMIDRVSKGISLLQVFGFRPNEIRQVYMRSICISVVLALLVAIPVSKCFCDWFNPYIYEYMAVGMFYSLPFRYYITIFFAAILLFLLILWILTGKIRRIPTSVVLKSRE